MSDRPINSPKVSSVPIVSSSELEAGEAKGNQNLNKPRRFGLLNLRSDRSKGSETRRLDQPAAAGLRKDLSKIKGDRPEAAGPLSLFRFLSKRSRSNQTGTVEGSKSSRADEYLTSEARDLYNKIKNFLQLKPKLRQMQPWLDGMARGDALAYGRIFGHLERGYGRLMDPERAMNLEGDERNAAENELLGLLGAINKFADLTITRVALPAGFLTFDATSGPAVAETRSEKISGLLQHMDRLVAGLDATDSSKEYLSEKIHAMKGSSDDEKLSLIKNVRSQVPLAKPKLQHSQRHPQAQMVRLLDFLERTIEGQSTPQAAGGQDPIGETRDAPPVP